MSMLLTMWPFIISVYCLSAGLTSSLSTYLIMKLSLIKYSYLSFLSHSSTILDKQKVNHRGYHVSVIVCLFCPCVCFRNGVNVEGATHKHVVELIHASGAEMTLTGKLMFG